MPSYTTHPTPNPNSLKLTTDGKPFIARGLASFSSRGEAAGDPLGERLFTIPDVVNVLILPQFLTVSKRPEADWEEVLPAVEAALNAYFEEAAG